MANRIDASAPVAKFISNVQSTSNRGAKSVMLSITEAVELSAAISQMLLRQNSLLEDIVELQKRSASVTQLEMDGGKF